MTKYEVSDKNSMLKRFSRMEVELQTFVVQGNMRNAEDLLCSLRPLWRDHDEVEQKCTILRMNEMVEECID